MDSMRRISRFAIPILLLLLVPAQMARAHHPGVGFGAGTAGPVITIPGQTMPRDQWAVGLRWDYQRFDAFSDAQLAQYAAQGEDVHSMDDQSFLYLSAGYGVTGDLTLAAQIPYVWRRGIREGTVDDAGAAGVGVLGDSEGIGDLSLVAQYRFLRQERSGVDVAALVGLRIPTGNTQVKDNDGVRFETEFQPGSGAWDPVVGVALSRRWDSLSLDASVLYQIATKGSQETNLGDSLNFGAAVSRRWIPAHGQSHDGDAPHDAAPEGHHTHVAWDFILEATGEWKQRQTVQGVQDPNSGGTLLMLSPGARVNVHERWSVVLSGGIPVIQNLNGRQDETRYRVILGISAGL
jgi:hypothetical protein